MTLFRCFMTILSVTLSGVTCDPDQLRLYDDLLTGYNPLFIPMTNTSDTQRVVMETNLRKIIDVNPEKGVLTSLIWLDLSWDDDYLR